MKKIVVAALALAVATVTGWYVQGRSRPANDAVVVQGTVRAVASVPVHAAVGGQIKEIAADFNTPVKNGQVLARIDPATFERRVSQAHADLEAARLARAVPAIKQREALLRQAELDLERTVIRAPADGTVILRNADVGQTVASGQDSPALFTIAPDLRTVQVEAALDEAAARRLRIGMTVAFAVDALPRRTFSGEIRQVRKGPTYTVVIAAANADLALLPGMSANVRMPPAP